MYSLWSILAAAALPYEGQIFAIVPQLEDVRLTNPSV